MAWADVVAEVGGEVEVGVQAQAGGFEDSESAQNGGEGRWKQESGASGESGEGGEGVGVGVGCAVAG